MPPGVQARREKFADTGNREPQFWLKHDPVRLLDADVSLKAARVPAEARVELAVAFSSIDLLPDSTANRVPDPTKGTPLQPPGAFTARFLSLTRGLCIDAVFFEHATLVCLMQLAKILVLTEVLEVL